MNQVQEVTKKLILAIEESPEYIRYQKAKTELNKYPILKAKADEFRKCNYEIQNSHRDIFEEADKLQQEYAEVLDNSFVREYLTAENAFCRVLQQINWQLIETLDFEADFEHLINAKRNLPQLLRRTNTTKDYLWWCCFYIGELVKGQLR